MSHPLLTAWLSRFIHDAVGYEDASLKRGYLDKVVERELADPTEAAIADRLERALDVCAFEYVGFVPCSMTRNAHGKHDHPYQPLVTP